MLEREEITGARASKRRESPAASYWSSDVERKPSLTHVGLRRAEVDRLNKIAVSDQGTLEGLTQFLTQSRDARPQIAEDKSICGTAGFEGGFCATLFQSVRNSLILKRRDVRVVEGARLEIGSLHAC